ncbi:MAG: outer membrane protein assembly factor BamB family protein [Candidatus Heimdallarchaeota archaeon]
MVGSLKKLLLIFLLFITPFSSLLPRIIGTVTVSSPAIARKAQPFSPFEQSLPSTEGGVLWESIHELSGDITTPPVVAYLTSAEDEQVVFLGTEVGLALIAVSTGEISWFHNTPGAVLSITVVSDLTGDSVNEVFLTHDSQLFNNTELLSGLDGSLLWSFRPTQNCWVDGLGYTSQETKSWSSLVLDDISSDGQPDFLITSYNAAFALEGSTGKLLWSYFASDDLWSSALLDDIDNDGFSDVALGSQDGYLFALSARDGSLLWQVLATQPESTVIDLVGTMWFDRSVFNVLTIPDVSSDGKQDLLITNENGYCIIYDAMNGESLSRVKVYSRTGEVPPESYYGSQDFYNVVAYPLSSSSYPGAILTVGRSSVTFGNSSFTLLTLDGDELSIEWTSTSLPSADIRGYAAFEAEDLTGNYTKLITPTGTENENNIREIEVRSLENNSIVAIWEIPVFCSSFSENFNFMENSFTYPFRGNYALLVDDFNGTSSPEVLIYLTNAGLFALDGDTGEELWRQTLVQKVSMEAFTDVNKDGTIDLLRKKLFYPESFQQDYYLYSELAVLSGTTGELLWNFSLPIKELAQIGGGFSDYIFTEDLTGDNVSDLWVVAQEGDEIEGLLDNASKIYLLDGTTGAVVWEKFATDPSFVYSKEQLRITSVATIHDQNGDNVTDLLVACERSIVYCMSGLTGEPLWNLSREVPSFFPNYRSFIPWASTIINAGNILGNETEDFIFIGDDSKVRMVDSDNFSTVFWEWSLSDYWVNYRSYLFQRDITENVSCLVFTANRPESSHSIILNLTSGEPLLIAEGDLTQQIYKLFVVDFNYDGFKDHILFKPYKTAGLDAGIYIINSVTGSLLSYYSLHKPQYDTNTWIFEQFFRAGVTDFFDVIDDMDNDAIPELILGYSIGRYNEDEENQGMVIEIISPGTFKAEMIKRFEIVKEEIDQFSRPPLYIAPFVKNLGDISGDGLSDILVTLMDYNYDFISSIVSLDPNLEKDEEDFSLLWKQLELPVFDALDPTKLTGLLNSKLVCTDYFGRVIPVDNAFEVVINSFEVIKKATGNYLISWETTADSVISEIFLNGLLVAITTESEYQLFLGNEAYNISIVVIDPYGIKAYTQLFYKVDHFNSLFVVWIIIGVVLVSYFGLKIIFKVKKKEDLTQFGPEINLPR